MLDAVTYIPAPCFSVYHFPASMGIPDEQIHPCATGNAAKTVDQHQEPNALVFYAGWFCPYVQRSWIVLEEKGISYQYKEVNPYKKEKYVL